MIQLRDLEKSYGEIRALRGISTSIQRGEIVGLLGPKQRAEDLLAELADQGVMPSDEQRARLYAPAGLDLGGEGPEAIAFSLVGEILALSEDRSGSWLRDRKGPIHDACPA